MEGRSRRTPAGPAAWPVRGSAAIDWPVSGAGRVVFKTANDRSEFVHDFNRAEGDYIELAQLPEFGRADRRRSVW